MFGNVGPRHKAGVIESEVSRKRKLSFWGAHPSGALAIAFCDRELCWAPFRSVYVLSKKSGRRRMRRQHAASVRSPDVPLTRYRYTSTLDHEHQKYDLVSARLPSDVHLYGSNRISKSA